MPKYDKKRNIVVPNQSQRTDGKNVPSKRLRFNKLGIRILSQRDSLFAKDRFSDER